MINTILIANRLALMTDYLKELDSLSSFCKEDFLKDKTKTGAAESYLRRSLEAMFDIGRHILAKSGLVDMASEYKSIAGGLHLMGITDQKLNDKLVAMAGYRNRLVHLYNEITDEELFNIITNDLGDIRNFIRQIRDYIKIHQ